MFFFILNHSTGGSEFDVIQVWHLSQ